MKDYRSELQRQSAPDVYLSLAYDPTYIPQIPVNHKLYLDFFLSPDKLLSFIEKNNQAYFLNIFCLSGNIFIFLFI